MSVRLSDTGGANRHPFLRLVMRHNLGEDLERMEVTEDDITAISFKGFPCRQSAYLVSDSTEGFSVNEIDLSFSKDRSTFEDPKAAFGEVQGVWPLKRSFKFRVLVDVLSQPEVMITFNPDFLTIIWELSFNGDRIFLSKPLVFMSNVFASNLSRSCFFVW